MWQLKRTWQYRHTADHGRPATHCAFECTRSVRLRKAFDRVNPGGNSRDEEDDIPASALVMPVSLKNQSARSNFVSTCLSVLTVV
jgi:hypothetical protein